MHAKHKLYSRFVKGKHSGSQPGVERVRSVYQFIHKKYVGIQMKGYSQRDSNAPIACKRSPKTSKHVPRDWDALNIERTKFDITLGDGDWEHR